MSSQRSTYRYPVIVGIFVTAGILILVTAIFTLGGQRGSFVSSRIIRARFTDIGGLKKGDNVWMDGVKVGMIRDIRIEGKSRVLVLLRIDTAIDSLVKQDSRVRISSDGIMGNRIVVIYGGSVAAPLFTDDDVMEADLYNDPQALFRTLGESSKDVAGLAANLRKITNQILYGQGVAGRLLNDTIVAQNLMQSSKSLQHTMARVETMSIRADQLVVSLQRSAGRLSEPGNIAYGLLEDTVMYQNLLGSSQQLKEALQSLAYTAKSLEKPGKALGQEKSMVGTILYDTLSGRHLKQTLDHIDSASRIMEQDLKALQHSIFLRRYFKKKDKSK